MTKKRNPKTDLIISVQELLQKKTVRTQEEIKMVLKEQGFVINQAKISRILHKIGAIKLSESGQIAYRLPTELISITPNDSLKQIILNVTYNDFIIIIHTAPGCGQFVARFLDQQKDIGI